jgi:hypothetical protein
MMDTQDLKREEGQIILISEIMYGKIASRKLCNFYLVIYSFDTENN